MIKINNYFNTLEFANLILTKVINIDWNELIKSMTILRSSILFGVNTVFIVLTFNRTLSSFKCFSTSQRSCFFFFLFLLFLLHLLNSNSWYSRPWVTARLGLTLCWYLKKRFSPTNFYFFRFWKKLIFL